MRHALRELVHYGRGRPSGQRQSMAEVTNRWYLIEVSEKYGLETRKFLASFRDAWTHGKSSCDDISIQCRQKTMNDGIFLVTRGQKVIAQLSLNQTTMKRLQDADSASFRLSQSASATKIEKSKSPDMKVKEVSLRVKRVSLKAKVVEKSTPRTVYSRYGNSLTLSTATISDGTGSIKLLLWNTQVDMVSVGDTVQIEKGRVSRFKGELQVSIGRDSKLKVI